MATEFVPPEAKKVVNASRRVGRVMEAVEAGSRRRRMMLFRRKRGMFFVRDCVMRRSEMTGKTCVRRAGGC